MQEFNRELQEAVQEGKRYQVRLEEKANDLIQCMAQERALKQVALEAEADVDRLEAEVVFEVMQQVVGSNEAVRKAHKEALMASILRKEDHPLALLESDLKAARRDAADAASLREQQETLYKSALAQASVQTAILYALSGKDALR